MNRSQAVSAYIPPRSVAHIRTLLTVNLIAFLISRAFILENAMPFGIAFFSVTLLNRYRPIPVFFSTTLGIISVAGLKGSYKYMIMMGILYIILHLIFRKRDLKKQGTSLITFSVMFGVSMLWLNIFGTYSIFDILIIGFEALAGGMLVYIFHYAFGIIKEWGKNHYISREEIICTAVAIAVAVSGVGALRVWHITIKVAIMTLLITISAYNGGAAVGSAAGALFGLTSGLMGTQAAAMAGVFSFGGLLAGTFRELGRAGSVLGFIIGSSILNLYVGGSPLSVIGMEELLIGSVLFMLIPGFVLEGLSFITGDHVKIHNNRIPYHIKAKEFAMIRLKEFATVFSQLSATFNDISFREDYLDIHSLDRLIDNICNRVCRDCSLRKICWKKDFYMTYKEIFELMCTAEEMGQIGEEHIPPGLKKRCLRPRDLTDMVNYYFELFKINHKWQLKMEDCRNLVSQQLGGMAGVIENLVGEMNVKLNFNGKHEDDIHDALIKEGIEIFNTVVIEKPGRGLEVYLEKKACFGCRECIKKVIPVVATITAKQFKKAGYLCDIRKGLCALKLVEKQRFNVSTGVYTAPKKENQINGDNYTFMELKEQQYLIALSDGMGTGAGASIESSTAINMLEQLLGVGYDYEMALRTINSIMMLKSFDDSFSTLDIALVDLYNGDAKIIKTGAPPTYIKRGDGVKVLAASSLPMGIVDKADYYTKKFSVKEGDFIVMVTDGIVEACKETDDGDWVAGILKTIDNRNPQEIARIIFEKTLEYYDGHPEDDMTVMVSKVWRNL